MQRLLWHLSGKVADTSTARIHLISQYFEIRVVTVKKKEKSIVREHPKYESLPYFYMLEHFEIFLCTCLIIIIIK